MEDPKTLPPFLNVGKVFMYSAEPLLTAALKGVFPKDSDADLVRRAIGIIHNCSRGFGSMTPDDNMSFADIMRDLGRPLTSDAASKLGQSRLFTMDGKTLLCLLKCIRSVQGLTQSF